MIREFVLQLKRGWVSAAYFSKKYGVDVRSRFREPLASLDAEGFLSKTDDADRLALSREGLLRVDVLLRRFFLPQHSGIRYT
jgi:oxygen-independent coproporphyrinogen-3 oxidase